MVYKLLTWKVGKDNQLLVGIDPFIGVGDSFVLSFYIEDYLDEFGSCTLNHTKRPSWTRRASSYWLLSQDLGLGRQWEK